MKEYVKIQGIKISKIAWGWYHSILLSESGYVFTFGRGNHGQLGHGGKDNISIPKIVSFFKDKKAIDIAGGFYHSIVLVNSRGPKLNSLSYDMKKLISDPSRWDITFKVGKEMYHGHRWIIYARWKELNKHIMKEAVKSDEDFREEIGTNSRNHWVMTIDDIQPKSFNVLLEFLYTGIVQNVQDFDSLVILDVFWLSLKYKIKKLACEWEEYLWKNIESCNWAVILAKTNELGEEGKKLKTISYNFIIENFGSVISTPTFLNLPKDIMAQIFSKASTLGVKINANNNEERD